MSEITSCALSNIGLLVLLALTNLMWFFTFRSTTRIWQGVARDWETTSRQWGESSDNWRDLSERWRRLAEMRDHGKPKEILWLYPANEKDPHGKT